MSKSKQTQKDRLIERTVQEVAQRYLERYYKSQSKKNKIFGALEVRTKRRNSTRNPGGKRADGFLAYAKSRKKAFVVSMEAKSYKTLPALKPYRVNKLWIRASLWFGFLVMVLSGSPFLIGRPEDFGSMRFILPFAVWAVASLLFAWIRRNSYKYKEVDVIHQVFQYPADEMWLSFSRDAFRFTDKKVKSNLIKIAKARDVGVLVVDPNKRVRLIHKPKRQKPSWKMRLLGRDYLHFYDNEDQVRNYLGLK